MNMLFLGSSMSWNSLRIAALDSGGFSDRVVRGGASMASALAGAWASTFAFKEPDHAKADEVISEYRTDSCVCCVPKYAIDDLMRAAAHGKPGMTRDEGIPYSAWRFEMALGLLSLVTDRLVSGLFMRIGFNNSISISHPKGEEEDDSVDLMRSHMNTHMFSLKNSDEEIISSVVDKMMRSTVPRTTNAIQRGFVSGCIGLHNVVDVHPGSRIVSLMRSPGDLPAMCFFDFRAAFPSVLRPWICLVFSKSGWPAGLINSMRGIYTHGTT